MDQEELYNLIAKFIRKAIPIKGEKLSIVNGLSNRVSPPQTPYILIQSSREGTLSYSQTRYTNQHKIIHQVCEVIVSIEFYGNPTIKSHKMAKAFEIRFNDSWASEQFAQYSNILFPLYSDDMKNMPYLDDDQQYADCYIVDAHFEYHTEVGMCQDSAKMIAMQVNSVDNKE
ncbi:phage neck terminator protein [Commensalibacter communis]|uniref:phage neck terminator protein n=1 Tax=Commensalibacter communis TaxID=2972786 RepID=UPI0038D10128